MRRYFILFNVMVTGIVSLISPSALLLLVYINAIDFCVLILYHAALLYSLMNCDSFLVASLGFSMYSTIPSANSGSFTSFPVWIPFIAFSLIAMDRTSKTMLNKSGESRHPHLVPFLRGNAFSPAFHH